MSKHLNNINCRYLNNKSHHTREMMPIFNHVSHLSAPQLIHIIDWISKMRHMIRCHIKLFHSKTVEKYLIFWCMCKQKSMQNAMFRLFSYDLPKLSSHAHMLHNKWICISDRWNGGNMFNRLFVFFSRRVVRYLGKWAKSLGEKRWMYKIFVVRT